MIAAIDIRGVTKVYNPASNQPVKALDDVSLTINDNEFFTLLGPSGCGKTTLLRLIAGFEQVSGGAIMLFDEEIENLEPNQRPINTVFQHYALFPHMTVADNVAFGLERLRNVRVIVPTHCCLEHCAGLVARPAGFVPLSFAPLDDGKVRVGFANVVAVSTQPDGENT